MSGRPPQWDWRRHQPACVPAWRGSLILAELAECGLLTVEELCELCWPGEEPRYVRQALRTLMHRLVLEGTVEVAGKTGRGAPSAWTLARGMPARSSFLQVPTPGRWAAAVRELEAALGPSR